MASRVATVMRRHPLVTFFVLAYVVAWGFVPFGSFGAFGPLVAALVGAEPRIVASPQARHHPAEPVMPSSDSRRG